MVLGGALCGEDEEASRVLDRTGRYTAAHTLVASVYHGRNR